MPPDRGRASRACDSCRKQKTRCYESGAPGRPCLRCERLRQRCSFVLAPPRGPEVASNDSDARFVGSCVNAVDPELNWPRLARLEQTLGALLERLGEDSTSITQPTTHPGAGIPVATSSSNDTGPSSKPDHPSTPPVMVIRDLASDIGVKSPDTSSQVAGLDGLIAPDLALSLFAM